jgi:hypothetical protein
LNEHEQKLIADMKSEIDEYKRYLQEEEEREELERKQQEEQDRKRALET